MNVQDNSLSALPKELMALNQLTVVNLRNNNFDEFPEAYGLYRILEKTFQT